MSTTFYKRIATLLAGYAILITGNGLLGTLLSLRLASPEFSTMAVGVVQSAYYLGFMLGALCAGHLIARIGHHRAFSVFAVVVACASLAHAFSASLPAWFVLRLVTGMCLAGIFTVLESLLNTAAGNQVRGRVFAFYMMTTYLGVASGQLMLNLASPSGFELFALVAVLFSASLSPVLLAGRQSAPAAQAQGRSGNRFDLKAVLATVRISPLGMCGCVLSGLLNSSFYTLMPVFLKGVGLSVGALSGVMFSALLTALVFQWPVGALSDRMDRRKVLLLSCMVVGGISLVMWSGLGQGGLAWLVSLYAAVAFTVYPVSVALINDRIPHDLRIPASAAVLLMFSVGGCAGPLMASLAVARLGPHGLFGFSICAAGTLAALVLAALLRARRNA
jgi:MFS family permease